MLISELILPNFPGYPLLYTNMMYALLSFRHWMKEERIGSCHIIWSFRTREVDAKTHRLFSRAGKTVLTWRQSFGWSRREWLYCFVRQRGPQWTNALETELTTLERVVRSLTVSSWTFFWLVGGEVRRSQHHPLLGSSWSEVYVFVGNIQLTSPTWWRFQTL